METPAATLRPLHPAYAATPLLNLPQLAKLLGVAELLAKDETRRMLGSFKSLGGTYAGLRALARAADTDIPTLLATRPAGQPALICASDGNHGLAVAAAARFAGAPARVYLHAYVPHSRAQRITDEGAEIIWVPGTYDDAVDAAAQDAAARGTAGILVADTTTNPNDPVVNDVMAGYAIMAEEIRDQHTGPRPTHLIVQAGVGGLAAAMAAGLAGWLAPPAAILIAEPQSAPAVAAALAAGHPTRIPGTLETAAEMLSCGEASAPALATLLKHAVQPVTLPETLLTQAPAVLHENGGPRTTPSGAAGLAAAMATQLPPEARVLILITEGAIA